MTRKSSGNKAGASPATTAELIEARVRELRDLVNAPMESASAVPLDPARITEHVDVPAFADGTLRFRTSSPAPVSVPSSSDPLIHLLDPGHHGTDSTAAAPPSATDDPTVDAEPPMPDAPMSPPREMGHRLHAVVRPQAMPPIDVDQAIADIAGRVQERIDAVELHVRERGSIDVESVADAVRRELAEGLERTQQLIQNGTEEIRSGAAATQTAAEGSLEGVIELISRSDTLHRGLQDEIARLRQQTAQTDPNPRIAALGGTVSELQGSIDALMRGQAELIRALLDRLEAGTRRVDQRLDAAMAELSGSVGGALETLQRRAIADGTALRNGLERVTSDLPRAILPRVAETVQTAQQHTDIRIGELQDRIVAAVASQQATTDERLAAFGEDLETHEAQVRIALQATADVVSQDLTAQLSGAVNDITESLRQDIASLHGSFARELDYNRLQHVRDVELLIDAMDAGWRSVNSRLNAADSQLAQLRGTVEQWFRQLADDEDKLNE